jgi:hypothetical protein
VKILRHDASSQQVGLIPQLSNSILPPKVFMNLRYWLLFIHQDDIPVPSIHSAANGDFLYETEQIVKCIKRWLRRLPDSRFCPTAFFSSFLGFVKLQNGSTR